jgi:DNA-binding NtrC family response regulator
MAQIVHFNTNMLLNVKANTQLFDDSCAPITARATASAIMVQIAQKVAPTNADILIEGEPGTGKRLLGSWIHRWSSRRSLPLKTIDCSAGTEAELEQSLFGAGVSRMDASVLRLPSAGSLLLSEVGELPMRLQAKLLWSIDEHDLHGRRGASTRARIIATSSQLLHERVAERRFRADLYYRLKVIPITVPPLRARLEDVPVMAEQFLAMYASDAPTMKMEFVAGLMRYAWPGNVAELRNLMRRTAALCGNKEIGAEYLHFDGIAPIPSWAGVSWKEAERRLLEQALAATAGNRTKTAEMLGISLRTVRNRIRDFGLSAGGVS